MKFVFFVEGHTEKKALPTFLKRWLDDRVQPRVGIKSVRFDGWAEYGGMLEKRLIRISTLQKVMTSLLCSD